MERRDFIKMMGIAPGALAASWHLDFAREKLVSHIESPEGGPLPDQEVFLRSVCTECPAGCGLRVRVRKGHPVKLEGDPQAFPGSGGLCVRGQASLARLYHPARLRTPLRRDGDGEYTEIGWSEALNRLDDALQEAQRSGATKAYIGPRRTGLVSDLLDELARQRDLTLLPAYELFHYGALRSAHEMMLGASTVPTYRLESADLIVTIGADLFESFLDPVGFAAGFADLLARGGRWVHLEPHLSLTGCNASERLVVKSGSEAILLAHLLGRLAGPGDLPDAVRTAAPEVSLDRAARTTGLAAGAIDGLAAAIERKRGRVLVISGGLATGQASGLQVAGLTALLQRATGQLGVTVDFSRPAALGDAGSLEELNDAARRLAQGSPGVLMISRLHTLAGAPEVRALADGARLRVALTDILYPPLEDCDLVLPLSHPLETWVDARAIDGTPVRHGPVFTPLFDTRAEAEVLLSLLGTGETLKQRVDGRAASPAPRGTATPDLRSDAARRFLAQLELSDPSDGPVLVLPASLRSFDGRSRPLTLLHEIPDPVSAVSYGDGVLIAPADCDRWGLSEGNLVVLTTDAGELRLPVRRQPGQPEGALSVPVDAVVSDPHVGLDLPVDPQTGELVRALSVASVRATLERGDLVVLSGSMDAAGKGILPGDAPAHGLHNGDGGPAAGPRGGPGAPGGRPITLFKPNPQTSDIRWAMAIDLDRCIGCSACVAACYVENNIPVVGPDEHRIGREMSWLRIQPYERPNGALAFIPLPCQHCDFAPCETVCPVYATYHNPEGLNAQVYNRCVGTRYCANNCPYKARRFNWFSFRREEPLDRMLNPEVSVRPKGVMEKCTFCIQRIRAAKEKAKEQERPLRDGDAVPACAESCPTKAIVFGNLLDPAARIYDLARSKRAYRVLEDLGTSPAVYYLSEDQAHES